MPKTSPERARKLLATARANPDFALRVALTLPDRARSELVGQLSLPERAVPRRRPGLAKCAPSPFAESNGLAAQLALFALGTRRR